MKRLVVPNCPLNIYISIMPEVYISVQPCHYYTEWVHTYDNFICYYVLLKNNEPTMHLL